MQLGTKATLVAIGAVVAFFAFGLGVGFFVRSQIDHDLGAAHAVLPFVVPMYQTLLAPFVYLGVRSLVAPNVTFAHATYSRERVWIDGQAQVVQRETGVGQSRISRKTGAWLLGGALAVFVIASLAFYALRHNIG